MFDDMYSIEELEAELGPARRHETLGAVLRTHQPANVAATELVSGQVMMWACGCRAALDDVLADGTPFYTLEPCDRHRQLKRGNVHPCVVLAELTGLSGKGLELAESPSAESCRRALTGAMELGIANIPVIFSRSFDELAGGTLNDILARGEIDRAADAVERILQNHPELRILRIET